MKAQPFSLADQSGTVHNLSDYMGKWLILYFYPQDDTSGCTTEACSFRDGRSVLAALQDVVVVGVSKDSVDSHRRFADKYDLDFTLLSDPDHKVIEAYGAWGSEGTLRNTVIIDPEGNIAKTYTNVDPATHVKQIVKDLTALKSQAR